MIDLGVLKAFHQALVQDEAIQKKGLDQLIHTYMPAETQYPYVLLELEEIWTSMRFEAKAGYVKLKIKALILSQALTTREPLGIADRIKFIVDGRTLDTCNGKKGIVRLSSSVIGLPTPNRPLTVQQTFDVLVSG